MSCCALDLEGLGARPNSLKNTFTSLCQKISKKPMMLAIPR